MPDPTKPPRSSWLAALIDGRLRAPADATRTNPRLPTIPDYPKIGPLAERNRGGRQLDLSLPSDSHGDMRDILTEHGGGLGILDVIPGLSELRGAADAHELNSQGHPVMAAMVGGMSMLPAGGALARTVERKLLKVLAEEGGATLTAAGKRFAGSAYMVADPAFTVAVKSSEEMQAFLRRPDVLAALQDGKYIGKWTDPATGITEINLSDPFTDQKGALKLAAQRGEQSIGHIEGGAYQGDIANPHAPVPDAKQLVAQMNGGKMMSRVTEIPGDKGKLLAQTYEGLPKNDPAAKGAYDALNHEVAQQYKAIEDAGFKIEFTDADPYKSSADMMRDVRENRTLKVFKTNDGAEHPYMTREQNDRFRAVHDFIAHAGGGNQFGAVGEENAYRIHASTLTPEAQRALATETRGQNSWVNFGPSSHLPVGERPFAEQKAALFPEGMLGDYDAMKAAEPEKVVSAAVRNPTTGDIYRGRTHIDAYDKMPEGAEGQGVYADESQGFVTNTGRFVNRKEAGQLAKQAQQVEYPEAFSGDYPKPLYAEDIKREVPQTSLLAPAVHTAPEGGNTIPLDVSINPEGVDASRPELYRPARADLSVLDAVKRRVKDVYTPAAERGLKENPVGAAWYDLSPLKKIFEEESPSGAQDFEMFTRLMGPTSAGTDVPMNIRQASLFYKLWKNGELTPEALRAKALTIPPGYGNRLNIRGPLIRVLEEGKLDPLNTPKTFRYSEQLGGKSWGGTALDRHVGYNVGLQGEHVGSEINAGVGRGFPTGGYAKTREVSTSPQGTHYAAIEDAMVREAQKMGVHPAVYQAAGWVGNAAKTGVEDARHPIEILNEKLGETMKKYGYKSRTAALRGFIRGETPLWALGGLGAYGLLSEDEPRAEGLLAEQ